jgi:hypothetical protein
MKPLQIEILTYAPTEFFHCLHCEVVLQAAGVGQPVHREQRETALPPDLQAEYASLADWARGVASRFRGRVQVRVVDTASLEGFYKTLRYRARGQPAVILDGALYPASDRAALDHAIEERLAQIGR